MIQYISLGYTKLCHLILLISLAVIAGVIIYPLCLVSVCIGQNFIVQHKRGSYISAPCVRAVPIHIVQLGQRYSSAIGRFPCKNCRRAVARHYKMLIYLRSAVSGEAAAAPAHLFILAAACFVHIIPAVITLLALARTECVRLFILRLFRFFRRCRRGCRGRLRRRRCCRRWRIGRLWRFLRLFRVHSCISDYRFPIDCRTCVICSAVNLVIKHIALGYMHLSHLIRLPSHRRIAVGACIVKCPLGFMCVIICQNLIIL